MSISNLEENSVSEFWLPQGGQLISILSSYNIKDFDLYSLLKKKGMLVGERDRKQMIMLLASTLITPADFVYLAKRISDREDKYRTTEASIQANEDVDAISDIITREYIDKLMSASSDKYPTFAIKDIEYENYSDGRVYVSGKVETHDWIRSLQATSKLHDFSFEVEHKGNVVRYISGTTTLETKKLISYIRDEVNKTLKNNGVVNRRSKIFILRNNYFDNQTSMFQFFRKFESNEYSCLKFTKIIDIIFNIHEFAKVPKEFKWMKEKINEISLKGDNIESNDVVKLGEKGCLDFGEIESEFGFVVDGSQGTCIIKYGFPAGHKKTKKGNSRSVEFETKLVSIDMNNKSSIVKKAIIADFNARKALICSEMINSGKLKNEVDNQMNLI